MAVAAARDAFSDAVVRAEFLEHVRAGRAFMRFFTQAAVVGQFSGLRLNTPAGGLTALIYAIALADTAAAHTVNIGSAAAGAPLGLANFNLRLGSAASTTTTEARQNAAAGIVNTLDRRVVAAGADVVWVPAAGGVIEVAPGGTGSSMIVENTAVNLAISGAYVFAEV